MAITKGWICGGLVSNGVPQPGGSSKIRGVEIATAIAVAFLVASLVIAIGLLTRDDPGTTASDETPDDTGSPEPEPTTSASGPDEPDDPVDGQTDDPAHEPVTAEVTDVELEVNPASYTGPCPVTLEFSARITTSTGPVRADYSWLDGDSDEAASDVVHFGGPGPDAEPVAQGATVTHDVEVADDLTVHRTLGVSAPNEITSNAAESTVTCTPYAEITKGGDDFDGGAVLCHELHFEATITVPHDMTVSYQWIRTDGPVVGPFAVDFASGGTQSQAVPGQTWMLGAHDGDFGFQLHILEPYDVMSELVTYNVNGCSGPAT